MKKRKRLLMLSDSLVYALFAYGLAFALAIMTAGIIKVVQIATSFGSHHASPSSDPEEK